MRYYSPFTIYCKLCGAIFLKNLILRPLTGGNKMSNKADELALMAILTSLVVAATALHMPMPGFSHLLQSGRRNHLYYSPHLGKPLWGNVRWPWCFSGRSALGPSAWAPFTLAIKGAEGFVVGHFARKNRNLALLAGASVMITGYAAMAGLLYGPKAIPIEIATDVAQTGIGTVLAVAAMPILKKAIGRYSPPGKQQNR